MQGSAVEAATQLTAPKIDELKKTTEQLRDAINQAPVGSEDMPGWLLEAAGNPRTYDAPDPSRVNV